MAVSNALMWSTFLSNQGGQAGPRTLQPKLVHSKPLNVLAELVLIDTGSLKYRATPSLSTLPAWILAARRQNSLSNDHDSISRNIIRHP